MYSSGLLPKFPPFRSKTPTTVKPFPSIWICFPIGSLPSLKLLAASGPMTQTRFFVSSSSGVKKRP